MISLLKYSMYSKGWVMFESILGRSCMIALLRFVLCSAVSADGRWWAHKIGRCLWDRIGVGKFFLLHRTFADF